uniref:Chitinase n=1 Tax=Rhipicephalus zambeziensis TaxID=60191 RepID=A0A224YVR0_9ACAR
MREVLRGFPDSFLRRLESVAITRRHGVSVLILLLAALQQQASAVTNGRDAVEGVTIPRNKFEVPVVCYYYGWASQRPSPANYSIEDVPMDMCTFVVLAFVGIDNETFEIKSMIPEYEEDERKYLAFTDLKNRHLYLKTMLAVGGWDHGGEVFSNMVSRPESRAAFVESAVRWMRDHEFDGLEILWKYPGYEKRGGKPRDKHNFVLLLKELKEAFAKYPLYLTATVPLDENYLDGGYDIANMERYVDWFNVLAYDLRGTWNRFTDVHSILYKRRNDPPYFQDLTIAQGMKRLVRMGAPKRKLMLGMGFYGRSYVLLDARDHGVKARIKFDEQAEAGPYVKSTELKAYYEICMDLKKGGWTREFDDVAKCPYAYKGDQWIGYEDEESVGYKMDFILREGYRGVMVFNNDLDDFRGLCGPKNPLMKVIFNKVGQKALLELKNRTGSQQPEGTTTRGNVLV